MAAGVRIEGLAEFRRDLRRAIASNPRELALGIRKVGEPLVAALGGIPAHRSGRLAMGYRVRVRGTTGSLVNVEPYGAKAEWSNKRGWRKYGPPGRFAARIVEERTEAIILGLYEALQAVVRIYGWAHGA